LVQTIGGRYVLEERLGEGGMGHVYRVRHVHLAKQFALKVISPVFAADSKARERFNTEARIASEVTHPNIVSVVDYGEDETFGAYMVMELLEGEPLVIGEGSAPTSVRRALDVLAQVADALDHIHKRGIVHGDVKAENLMLVAEPAAAGTRRRRIVRLLDFGLARRFATQAGELGGTPHYLAPECCTGEDATVASDVYALGVLGYILFSRTFPFDGSMMEILDAHVHAQPVPPSQRRGEPLDDAIDKMIMRALSKHPAGRHPSAAAFRYELNAVMDMLDMRPRRRPNLSPKSERHDVGAAQLFENSVLAQALVRKDNTIAFANQSFSIAMDDPAARFGDRAVTDTPLTLWLPELVDALAGVRRKGQPIELRARRWESELVVWLAPVGIHGEVHLLAQRHAIERPKPVKPRL
jgi:serine/threonine protein kinase